jgi:hypothetical protein
MLLRYAISFFTPRNWRHKFSYKKQCNSFKVSSKFKRQKFRNSGTQMWLNCEREMGTKWQKGMTWQGRQLHGTEGTEATVPATARYWRDGSNSAGNCTVPNVKMLMPQAAVWHTTTYKIKVFIHYIKLRLCYVTLRRATVNFAMSVRPSVCLSACLSVRPSVCLSVRPSVRPSVPLNNSAPTGHVYEILNLSIFRTSVEKIQVPLQSDKNNRYCTWRSLNIYDSISLNLS